MGRRSLPHIRSLLLVAPLLAGVATACARPMPAARSTTMAGAAHASRASLAPARAHPASANACEAPALHWPVADGARTLTVSLDASAAPELAGPSAAQLDDAIAQWNRVGLPLRLARTSSHAAADIRVQLVDRLEAEGDAQYLAGTTRLMHTERGAIARATVLLALRAPSGTAYADADRGLILLHELGHALGLPHADDATLMAPRPVVFGVTRRDERAARALYATAAACRESVRLASRDED